MIAFTLCSNNYLALAKTLADSWRTHNPGHEFIFGLVDKKAPGVDYAFLGAEVVSIDEIGIERFDELNQRYNITELNTAVKPFFFDYLFRKRGATKVVYLDPDILVFHPFDEMDRLLDRAQFVITPHICSRVDGDAGPNDQHLLKTGVFNLGFLALSAGDESRAFIAWWSERMRRFAYRVDHECLFYDQIWVNYVPAFYEGVHILRSPAYNVANWNLHERHISRKDGVYFVNDLHPLVFFHFSHYKLSRPDEIASYNHRFTFKSRPDIVPLYEQFRNSVAQNRHAEFGKIPCAYGSSSWELRKRRATAAFGVARSRLKHILGI